MTRHEFVYEMAEQAVNDAGYDVGARMTPTDPAEFAAEFGRAVVGHAHATADIENIHDQWRAVFYLRVVALVSDLGYADVAALATALAADFVVLSQFEDRRRVDG